jgi:hypothetical protein
MWYAFGNQPITSTGTEEANPTTSVLLAKLSSLAANDYEARIILGASTYASFAIEQAFSSAVPGTLRRGGAYLGRQLVYASLGQSAQYILRFRAEAGDCVRVHLTASLAAATAAATIQLEPMD